MKLETQKGQVCLAAWALIWSQYSASGLPHSTSRSARQCFAMPFHLQDLLGIAYANSAAYFASCATVCYCGLLLVSECWCVQGLLPFAACSGVSHVLLRHRNVFNSSISEMRSVLNRRIHRTSRRARRPEHQPSCQPKAQQTSPKP